jgi:hypothetical protein
MTLAAALANWSNVYRTVLCSREVKPYNLEVAIQYGAMDMLNLTKGMTEDAAAYLINDDAAYMTEKMQKEAA